MTFASKAGVNVIVVVLSGIMQSIAFFIVMLCDVMLDAILLSVLMRSVVKWSVVSLSVVAPTGERKKVSFEKEGEWILTVFWRVKAR